MSNNIFKLFLFLIYVFFLLIILHQGNNAVEAIQCYVDPRTTWCINSSEILRYAKPPKSNKKLKSMTGNGNGVNVDDEPSLEEDSLEMNENEEEDYEAILDEEQKEFMTVDWEMSKNKSEELYFNATGNEISANRGMWKRKKIQKECSPNAKYCAIFQCSDAKLGMAKVRRKCLEMKASSPDSPNLLCSQFKRICKENGGQGNCLICHRHHFCNHEFLQLETDSEEGNPEEYVETVPTSKSQKPIFNLFIQIFIHIIFYCSILYNFI